MRRRTMAVAVLIGNLILQIAFGQTADNPATGTLVEKINVVDFAKANGSWSSAQVGQSLDVGDRVRTGEDSRATVRLSDSSVLRVDELTTIEILPPKESNTKATLDFKQGSSYFFSREKSREVSFKTPAANGAIRGTELLLSATAQLRAIFVMLKGGLELSNAHGAVILNKGEEGDATADAKPTKHPISADIGPIPWHLLIESKLATGKTLKTASPFEVSDALCGAIKQWPEVAPQIVQTTVTFRKELAREIVKSGIRCIGAENCELIVRMVAAAVAADPSDAAGIIELAMQLAPHCRAALETVGTTGEGAFANPPSNQNPPPGSAGGGAGTNVCIVCHNGQDVQISCADLDAYLASHPGDTAGPCQVTPTTNQ